jgi:hypothetical protein
VRGGVDALEVVVVGAPDQVALECCRLGRQGAGEAGSAAPLEDGPLNALDAAVGLRPAGPDEALVAPMASTAGRNSRERNSGPLSVETACNRRRAAASSTVTRRARAEVRRAAGSRGADVALDPREGAGHLLFSEAGTYHSSGAEDHGL